MQSLNKIISLLLLFTFLGNPILPVFAQEASDTGVLSREDSTTPSPEITPTEISTPTATPDATPTPTGASVSSTQEPTVTVTPTIQSSPTPTDTLNIDPTPLETPNVLGPATLTPTPSDLGQFEDLSPSARIRQRLEVLPLFKSNFLSTEQVRVRLANTTGHHISVTIVRNDGKKVKVRLKKNIVNNSVVYDIEPGDDFAPGKYTLTVSDEQGTVSTQDFTWGVLAINTNKPVYKPGDQATIQIAVLDEVGKMVCDADVTLQIISEAAGVSQTLTTKDGGILVHDECFLKGFTLVPDYEAQFQVQGEGNYHMILTAETGNGSYTVRSGTVFALLRRFRLKLSAVLLRVFFRRRTIRSKSRLKRQRILTE